MDNPSTNFIPIFMVSIGLAVVAMAGVLTNSAVMMIVIWNRSLFKPINLFHFHLAFMDIMMACTCVPFSLAEFLPMHKSFGEALCMMSAYIVLAIFLSSGLLIMALAMYHYVFITAPLEKTPSPGQCLIMITSALAVALLTSSGPLFDFGSYSLSKSVFGCEYFASSRLGFLTFNFMQMAVGYIFPLLVLLFCYVSIWREMKHYDVRISKSLVLANAIDRQTEAVIPASKLKQAVTHIVFSFVLFRTPYFVYILLNTRGRTPYLETCFDHVAFWSAYFQAAINPFLYAFRHGEFQDKIRGVLSTCCISTRESICCCCCCHRRSAASDQPG